MFSNFFINRLYFCSFKFTVKLSQGLQGTRVSHISASMHAQQPPELESPIRVVHLLQLMTPHFMDFDKYNDMYPTLQYHTEQLHCPKNSLCSTYLCPLQSQETTDLFTVFIILPFPECHRVGIIQYVAFSDCLISLKDMHLIYPHAFLWLDSSFLLNVKKYSLCRCTIVHLSIHLLKDNVIASKF